MNSSVKLVPTVGATTGRGFMKHCALAAAILLALVLGEAAHADDGTWTVDADGNWSDPGNWDSGTVADGTGFFAGFSNITASRTVTLDTNRTIGNLSFSDDGSSTNRWVLSGPNTLTLDVTSGPPTINAATPTTISTVLAGNDGLRKQGFEVLQLTAANTYSGSTTINSGPLQAIDGVGLPSGSNLVLNGSSATFQSSGTFTRDLGLGAGQVQWISGGGFSAAGGTLAVRLGGNTNTVTWGSGNFVFAGQNLVLGSVSADSLVDFQNGINLAGGTRTVSVLDNPSSATDFAQISGPITNGDLNKSSSGTLIMTGTNSYGNTRLSTSISNSTVQIGNGGTTGTLGTGSVTFNSTDSLVFNRSDSLTVTNSMQRNGFGAKGTIIQDGTGTTTLAGDGASANSYDGALTVRRGTLVLDYNTFDSSKVGNGNAGFLTIGSAALQLAGGTHQEEVTSTSITGAATISRNSGSATLRLNALTMGEGASLDLSVDDLADTDSTNVNGVLSGVTVGGNLAKNSTNADDGQIRALDAADYTQVARLGGVVADDATTNVQITDTGNTSGDVTLAAAGTTTINTLSQGAGAGATVDIGASNTLRLGATGTIVANNGQTLALTGGTLTAGGTDDTAGTLLFSNAAEVTVGANIADNGTGAVTLAKSGAGSLVLTSANTYTGKTFVNAGTLVIADENRLGNDPASLTADQLTLNGGTLRTIATMALDDANRGVTVGAAGGTFSPDDSTTLTVASAIAGATPNTALTKTGVGTLVLTGSNTYAGGTTVSTGTLLANNTGGSATGTGNVSVQDGATFGGTGAISGSVSVLAGGKLAPGASIESLDIGALTLTTATSHLSTEIDLGSILAADLLNVTGAITLTNSTLDLSLLNLPTSQSLPLTFLLIANDSTDAVTGTFGTINLPTGFSATVNYAFTGNDALLRTGTGNDIAVTISAIAVPEPNGIVLFSIASLAVVRRVRRRSR
jgi:fibronectin-binding autotransporter adhesin